MNRLFYRIASSFAACWAIYLLLNQQPFAALTIHTAAAIAGAWAACRMLPQRDGSGWFEWAGALLLPIVGGPFIWITQAASQRAPQANLVDEYSSYIDASERGNVWQQADTLHYTPPAPADVESIAGILQSDTEEWEKRNAIEVLLRLETPDSVKQLRQALKDGSPEVKIYAASALSRLEERLNSRLESIENRFSDPNPQQQGQAHLIAAQIFLDFVSFDLIDQTRRQDYLQQAQTHADAAWDLIQDASALLLSAHILLKMKIYQDAADYTESFLKLVPGHLQGLLARADACFQLGRYEIVQSICRELNTLPDLPDSLQDTIRLWI